MKTIGIYPGQFQPPHKGHYASYKKLKQTAGADTFIATTDFDPTLEAALHFGDKEQIWSRHGVPGSHIRKVKNPLEPKEILDNYDPNTTVVIMALDNITSMKLIDKSSYYKGIGFSGGKFLPFKNHIYILTIDDSKIGEKRFTSKNIREALGSHRYTKEQKEKWFKYFFGWFDLGLFELLKNKYSHAHQSDTFQPDTIREELSKEIRRVVSELSYDNTSSSSDMGDGSSLPTVDNMSKNNADARRQAQQQKQDLVKQKQEMERDLKSQQSDLKWKNNSVMSLRKDDIPNTRKQIDNINQQITNTSINPPTSGT